MISNSQLDLDNLINQLKLNENQINKYNVNDSLTTYQHLKKIYEKIPLVTKGKIFRMNINKKYIQSLTIQLPNSINIIFSIINHFNNQLGDSDYHAISWHVTTQVTIITNKGECYDIKRYKFNDLYEKIKSLYYNITFDEFDELIKIKDYNIKQHIEKQCNVYKNLIKEFTSYANIDKRFIEKLFKPIYAVNDIKFYTILKNNKEDELDDLIITSKDNIINEQYLIVQLIHNNIISNDDFLILRKLIKFKNDTLHKGDSALLINPYTGKFHFKNEATNKVSKITTIIYEIVYEDCDCLIVGFSYAIRLYIKKINGYFINLNENNHYDLIHIKEIEKRFNLFNKLANKY